MGKKHHEKTTDSSKTLWKKYEKEIKETGKRNKMKHWLKTTIKTNKRKNTTERTEKGNKGNGEKKQNKTDW